MCAQASGIDGTSTRQGRCHHDSTPCRLSQLVRVVGFLVGIARFGCALLVDLTQEAVGQQPGVALAQRRQVDDGARKMTQIGKYYSGRD